MSFHLQLRTALGEIPRVSANDRIGGCPGASLISTRSRARKQNSKVHQRIGRAEREKNERGNE